MWINLENSSSSRNVKHIGHYSCQDRTAGPITYLHKFNPYLKSMLQKSDIVPNKKCWDNNCPVCLTEEKGLCCRENAGYSIQCLTCWNDPDKVDRPTKERKNIMHGETNRTARVRCLEHKSALTRRDNSNLWEHCLTEHSGQQAEFAYKGGDKYFW